MTVPIAVYFVTTRLRDAGWPRKRGLLRRCRFDAIAADAIVDDMIDWAAAVGAGRPKVAMQLAAHIISDCATHVEDAPTMEGCLEQARVAASEGVVDAPHDRVRPVRFADAVGATFSDKTFSNVHVRAARQQWCLEGLAWGLANPAGFERWYRWNSASDDSSRGVTGRPLNDLFATSEQVIRKFERETHPMESALVHLITVLRSYTLEL